MALQYLGNIFRERGWYQCNWSDFEAASNNNQQVRFSFVLGDALTKEELERCIFVESMLYAGDKSKKTERSHIRYRSNVHSYMSSPAAPKSGTRLLKRAVFPLMRATERRWKRCWIEFCSSSPVWRAYNTLNLSAGFLTFTMY